MGHAPEVVYRYVDIELGTRMVSGDWTLRGLREWRQWMIGPEHDLKVQPSCSVSVQHIESIRKNKTAISYDIRRPDEDEPTLKQTRTQNPLLFLQKR